MEAATIHSEMDAATPYQTDLISVKDLSPTAIAQMAQLYLAHYQGSSPTLFTHDLQEKQEVLVLTQGGVLVGFTSFLTYEIPWQQRLIRVVYSGDTIVAQAHWGQQALALAGLAHMGHIKSQAPDTPLYWFLLVKGHRTYKYLSVFAQRFFPHWQRKESELQHLADHLASTRFGAAYQRACGVVRFNESHGHLHPDIAEPTQAELRKESTQYFMQRNPGYRQGDELVCLCEIAADNLKPLAQRVFLKGLNKAAL